MRRRQLLKSLPFCVSLYSSVTYAQNRSNNIDDIEQLFNIAAAKHKRELRDLLVTRARLPIHLDDVSAQSIARVLAVSEETTYERTYPSGTSVLFYSYEEESLQIWLVDSSGIQAYSNKNVSKQQISEFILRLRNAMNIDSLQRSRIPLQRGIIGIVPVVNDTKISLNQAVFDLTQVLVPVEIVNKLIAVKHLIIVPVLEIGTVPFAILKPFGDQTLLIDKMSISIAPSLFDIGQSLENWFFEDLSQSPLIVGDPYLPESMNWSVPPLPGAEQEARAVAEMMNATPLLGREATKTEVVSKAEKASLLYFATHGVASSRDPLSGGFLMLSAARFEQGWWTTREIQNTRLSAEIAVLSACQTGLGQVHDAGIIGLSRAFQIAGVPRVVMSLWSVDDQATSQLMQAFAKHLEAPNSLETTIPSEALRQAMLEVRQYYPEPSKWASFVIFGTPR